MGVTAAEVFATALGGTPFLCVDNLGESDRTSVMAVAGLVVAKVAGG